MKRHGRFALGDLDVEVCEGRDSIWALIRREGRGGLALRTAHVPGGQSAIVFGAGEAGSRLTRSLIRDVDSGYHPVALFVDNKAKAR